MKSILTIASYVCSYLVASMTIIDSANACPLTQYACHGQCIPQWADCLPDSKPPKPQCPPHTFCGGEEALSALLDTEATQTAGEQEIFVVQGCSYPWDSHADQETADASMYTLAQAMCGNRVLKLVSGIEHFTGRCAGFADMPFSKAKFSCLP